MSGELSGAIEQLGLAEVATDEAAGDEQRRGFALSDALFAEQRGGGSHDCVCGVVLYVHTPTQQLRIDSRTVQLATTARMESTHKLASMGVGLDAQCDDAALSADVVVLRSEVGLYDEEV